LNEVLLWPVFEQQHFLVDGDSFKLPCFESLQSPLAQDAKRLALHSFLAEDHHANNFEESVCPET
jgi:hypothetical protein